MRPGHDLPAGDAVVESARGGFDEVEHEHVGRFRLAEAGEPTWQLVEVDDGPHRDGQPPVEAPINAPLERVPLTLATVEFQGTPIDGNRHGVEQFAEGGRILDVEESIVEHAAETDGLVGFRLPRAGGRTPELFNEGLA